MEEQKNFVYEPKSMDYFDLLKESKKLGSFTGKKTIRLAILADFASQQLVPLIKSLSARKGIKVDIYEAGYDSIDTEILNPKSELYRFQPDFIALLLATPKLKTRLYTAIDRDAYVDYAVTRLSDLWDSIRQNSTATVIQSNYVLPSERAFGNYEAKVPHSIGSAISAINYKITEKARDAKNVLLCDVDYIAAEKGRSHWADERLWSMAKTFCRFENLPFFAKAITDVILSAQGFVVKCVILDLDNTLWGGVIGDDGVKGIKLGDYDEGDSFVAFQRFILELKRRGIILAVVSKNDHQNAILPFKEHPSMVLKEEDIAVFVANWENKADNIRRVQQTLNIGFDSMVFLDDNPFERNIVRQYLPDVIVPEMPEDPSLYVRALSDLNLFETSSYSDADRQRADQYREEAQRSMAKSVFTNVDDYLKSLDMKIRLEKFSEFNLPRIAQLIQRSNQFNLTTRRYGEAACEALMNDQDCIPFTVTLSDKFGDYGLISVIILKKQADALIIDQYLMSCRVLQRGVEQFVMNTIFKYARLNGFKKVIGHYIRTDKNNMVKDFYSDFGFVCSNDKASEDTAWELSVGGYQDRKFFMDCQANEIIK